MSTNLISRIFVVLLVVAVAMVTLSFVNRSAASVVADRSYDTIEQLRIKAATIVADSSYDAIEQLRLQATTVNSVIASAYDQIEALRTHRSLSAQPAYRGSGGNPSLMALQAYLDFRHGEQTTGVNAAKARLDYRRGEWSGK